MKLKTSLLTLVLVGTGMAQAPPNKNVTPQAKPPVAANTTAAKPAATVTTPAKPAAKSTTPAKPATTPAQVKPEAKRKAKPPAKAKTVKKADATAKPADQSGDAKGTASNAAPELRRRDPFVSVIMARDAGTPCAGTGKKCLIIDQVMLKGVVRARSGSIAIVTGSANKTFFLRESDPVYNGVVVKITPDSIVFRESVTDRLGKTTQREVVKKVNNTAV